MNRLVEMKNVFIFVKAARRLRTLTRNRRLCKSNPLSHFFLQTYQAVRCVATIKSHSKSNPVREEKTTNYKSCSVNPHQELAISETFQLVGAKKEESGAATSTFFVTCKAQMFFGLDFVNRFNWLNRSFSKEWVLNV